MSFSEDISKVLHLRWTGGDYELSGRISAFFQRMSLC